MHTFRADVANMMFLVPELEIAARHLPFSEQNMNMADQNIVGSAIWLTIDILNYVTLV
jgi:hypothetical protein